jgi:hypothetical protein
LGKLLNSFQYLNAAFTSTHLSFSCFITNPYAALGGLIAPALIFIMVLAVVFIQSFQVTPQWQAYDDIYRGRYNVNGE